MALELGFQNERPDDRPNERETRVYRFVNTWTGTRYESDVSFWGTREVCDRSARLLARSDRADSVEYRGVVR